MCGRFSYCIVFASILVIFFSRITLAAPTLTSVTPSSGFQGATFNLTIAGSGFASSGTNVLGGAGVIVNSIRVLNSTSIVASVTLLGDPGTRTISVDSGGTSNGLPFEILPSPLSNPQSVAVSHFTGPEGGLGTNDERGTEARFHSPGSIWSEGANLFVADTFAQTIRKIVIATRDVTTLAGSPGQAGYVDAVGPNARFNVPNGIWGDGAYLYVVESGFGRLHPRPDEPLYQRPVIRVMSLASREVRSIVLPLFTGCCPIVLNPFGMWGINGYLYTTWYSRPGSLPIARINVTSGDVEWLFRLIENPEPMGRIPSNLARIGARGGGTVEGRLVGG
ncbi:MAG: IPT/TIG domain-containing protein, partial [Acidobacteria bacterium]|nr:IPT/TIG domain-containing protein [Acidobacteriota bacterium]